MSSRLSISNQLPRLLLISHCSASLIILREDYVEVTLLEQVLENIFFGDGCNFEGERGMIPSNVGLY